MIVDSNAADTMTTGESRDSSVGILVKTDRGCCAFNSFGFGVQLKGQYTVAEIFNTAVKHRPDVVTTYHPAVSDWKLYNEFVWTPWSRLTNRTGEYITKRCKLHTIPTQSDEVVMNYVGSGDRVENAWTRYITTSERISVLTKFSKSLNGIGLLDLGCACGNGMLSLASYGVNVYGVENHPEMYNHRSQLLLDRIIFGDVLECLYAFTQNSFDVVMVSMLGSVWWNDVREFFTDVSRIVRPGGIVILDTMPHKHASLKAVAMYKAALSETGFQPKLKTENMLVGVRTRK